MPGIGKLSKIIKKLRSEKGCPWDRKQTPQTIKAYLLEEAYEVLEALEQDDVEEIRSELGDLLFQLLFMIHLFEEQGCFSLEEVVQTTADKMIRRHPHVFSDAKVRDAREVVRNWRLIKEEERKQKNQSTDLDSIPAALPALLRAQRVGERASKVGFDWTGALEAAKKVEEEWAEFRKALEGGARSRVCLAEELGDLLFSLVNVARLLEINAEFALRGATGKFISRFRSVVETLRGEGRDPEESSLEELDQVWEEVKHRERRERQSLAAPKGDFEHELGHVFQRPELLETALCHSSFAHEHPDRGLEDNERLEFLGDALLGLIISRLLYERFPDASEGDLTRWRSYLVNETSLARVARSIKLGQALLLGAGEDSSGGRDKNSILADALEAVLGAIYLDGGMEAAQSTIKRLFNPFLEEAVRSEAGEDFKTRFQELAQALYKVTPEYHLLEAIGPDHDKTFRVSVTLGGVELAQGTGKSKKEATQNAARLALENFGPQWVKSKEGGPGGRR
jgi:tetrapyrrole methylase family protein/MazG family protein